MMTLAMNTIDTLKRFRALEMVKDAALAVAQEYRTPGLQERVLAELIAALEASGKISEGILQGSTEEMTEVLQEERAWVSGQLAGFGEHLRRSFCQPSPNS